jgi:hypothetical protein
VPYKQEDTVSPQIVEYQIIRPDGTLLRSVLAPVYERVNFAEPRGFEIRGEILTRYRLLPDGEWVVTARYPDGLSSTPDLVVRDV